MYKLVVDAGTTWSKVLELYSKEYDSILNDIIPDCNDYRYPNAQHLFLSEQGEPLQGNMYIFPSNYLIKKEIFFDAATGHMVKNRIKTGGKYENEVISLAYGAKKILREIDNATILDIGSRDIKWVNFQDGKYKDLDWNGSCGSATGATVEMLLKFYGVDTDDLRVSAEKIPVTCGVFSMEKIMDMIASGLSPDIALSRYISGIAYNTWKFARKPERIFLSGGFCNNSCFVESLSQYCEVTPLGRFVLLEGLY